jgi:hypothetical protein
VATRLAELNQPGLAHLMVKAAVVLGLGRKDRERELLSELLSDLHPSSISDDQMAAGFTRLLQSVDDLVLDNPDAGGLRWQPAGHLACAGLVVWAV